MIRVMGRRARDQANFVLGGFLDVCKKKLRSSLCFVLRPSWVWRQSAPSGGARREQWIGGATQAPGAATPTPPPTSTPCSPTGSVSRQRRRPAFPDQTRPTPTPGSTTQRQPKSQHFRHSWTSPSGSPWRNIAWHAGSAKRRRRHGIFQFGFVNSGSSPSTSGKQSGEFCNARCLAYSQPAAYASGSNAPNK